MTFRKRAVFLTRRGCGICDATLDRLRIPALLFGVRLEVDDIDADADLWARFGDQIPVLLSGTGEVLSEGPISRSEAWRAAFKACTR